ncbi:MAG: DUF1963 domain-containing protein [Saprospiraceae bacterium]
MSNKLSATLIEKLQPLKKIAYLPQVEKVEATFSAKSKIGGFPYLRNEDDWPVCPNCKKHQQLFLQLDLSQLPERQSEGLIQLFYCTTDNREFSCEDDLNAFEPFSKATTCRKIQIDGDSATIKPTVEQLFEEKVIKSWKAVDDFPHGEELYELDIELSDEEMEAFYDSDLMALAGDKLFGYPHWVQGVEYPTDENGDLMEMLFQFDSEYNLPYMFGDSGVGHLTQSKHDDALLAFGWACS